MARTTWQSRIVIDSGLHHGDPCIKGTRIPVTMVVGSLADGMTIDEVRSVFPQLTVEDILACLSYAADVMRQELLIPLAV